jgi:ABC-2 type transport system permease protein
VDVAYKQGGLGQQAAGLVNAAVDQVDRDAQGAAQVFSVRPRVLNASVGVIDTFLPGLLGFNLVNSGLLLAAGIFAGYRSSGVLRRIKVTGTAPINLVLAHATASLILTIVQISLLIVVTMALFTVRLDVVSLLLVSLLGYLVFLALGFAISGWVRDAQRAPVVASSIGMPLIFIALFPPDIFSGVARVAVGLLPISFLTHGLRQIVEGGDLGTVRLDLLGLAVWAVVLLVGAGWTFRWD